MGDEGVCEVVGERMERGSIERGMRMDAGRFEEAEGRCREVRLG